MLFINLIRGLSTFAWLAFFGVIIYAVVRAARGRGTKGSVPMVLIVLVLAVVLTVVSAGLVFVSPYEVAVVETIRGGGIKSEPLGPGLHWIVPFAENAILYPTSRQTYTMSIAPDEGALLGDDSIEARTADGQIVHVDASVIFTIDPTKVITVHQNWRNTYEDKFIRTLTRGITRDAVSAFEIEEVYSSKRIDMIEMIRSQLAAKLSDEGFILVDFVLRNVTFSAEYAASVEQKQIAEQLAEQAAFVVEQRKQEAQQARELAQGEADAAKIRAEGEAAAITIIAQAEAEARVITATAEAEALALLGQVVTVYPDVLTLVYIEKIAPNIKVMILPSDSPFILPLPE